MSAVYSGASGDSPEFSITGSFALHSRVQGDRVSFQTRMRQTMDRRKVAGPAAAEPVPENLNGS
jgi:hypothetical protein